ncbi:response regulator [Sulfurimonas sediminis]|uniref:Response regulator n=1 Tax=Sulfurimonas sediminis TaxID=2590020 RepID=A0A7M1AYI4_9BACT|nr:MULTISPECIES: HD domain-containing phosphohydrolase [Sulfurimonas]QOP42513.1 response regulator [Sulfurimonas sediminis]UCN00403.1 response regulator [Sulfurimonas sp. SWIR-19]
MAKVLLCDDELMNRKVASKILKKEGFEVIEAQNGQEALDIMQTEAVDLVLLDLMMPVMDGYTALKIIKEDENISHIPVIIISALSDREAITKGLKIGANEYITKPFDITEFLLRVKNAVRMGELQNKKNEKEIIHILAKTAEYRDNETSMHTIRVGEISAYLAKKIGWNQEEIELMRLAAPMHDMGKVGIPDNILLKPGKLNDDEFEIMKTHAQIGYEILSQKSTPLLVLAAEIALTHHEKYNGTGYPKKLQGDAIPLSGAIVAVVDVFDALLSKRPYKEPFSIEKTLEIIKEGSGVHFHPEIVHLFLENIEDILHIRESLLDD